MDLFHSMLTESGACELDKFSGGTDKCIGGQGYVAYYDRYFRDIRNNKIRLLEMGLGASTGCPSLKMWESYFPNGEVFGVDCIADCGKYQGRGKVILGNLEDEAFRNGLKSTVGRADIIIDDASHHVIQQQMLFREFWPLVKPGGVYVIEDLCGSYMRSFGGGHKVEGTTVKYLKTLVDCVNHVFYKMTSYWPHMAQYAEVPEADPVTGYDTTIQSIHFYQNIAFLFKRKDAP